MFANGAYHEPVINNVDLEHFSLRKICTLARQDLIKRNEERSTFEDKQAPTGNIYKAKQNNVVNGTSFPFLRYEICQLCL